MQRSTLFLAALSLTTAIGPAAADPVADFYAGKQIKFVIRSGVGGSYDQYSRLLARHMGKHIPGNPALLPLNMPGGGGIRSANYVAKIAPQDGTVLTMVSQGLPVDQALGLNPSFQADLRDFAWIGNVSSSNQVLVTWHTSPTKTLDQSDDARDRYRLEPGRLDLGADAGSAQQHRRNQDQDRIRLSGRPRHQSRHGTRRSRRPRHQSMGELSRHRSALRPAEADHPDHPDGDGKGLAICSKCR